MISGLSKRKLQTKTNEEVSMFEAQQVTGPVAPGQYGAGQYGAMQVSGPSAYYPTQTTDPYSGMFTAMMPMIMMVMMLAMIMPMLKGVTAKD
jgi:hypothetical protein